jgi:hypothetical protein
MSNPAPADAAPKIGENPCLGVLELLSQELLSKRASTLESDVTLKELLSSQDAPAMVASALVADGLESSGNVRTDLRVLLKEVFGLSSVFVDSAPLAFLRTEMPAEAPTKPKARKASSGAKPATKKSRSGAVPAPAPGRSTSAEGDELGAATAALEGPDVSEVELALRQQGVLRRSPPRTSPPLVSFSKQTMPARPRSPSRGREADTTAMRSPPSSPDLSDRLDHPTAAPEAELAHLRRQLADNNARRLVLEEQAAELRAQRDEAQRLQLLSSVPAEGPVGPPNPLVPSLIAPASSFGPAHDPREAIPPSRGPMWAAGQPAAPPPAASAAPPVSQILVPR